MKFRCSQRLVLRALLFLMLILAPSLVAGTPQTITFPAIPVKKQTDNTFTLAATASSGLPVSYQVVGGSNVASVSGNVVTLSGVTGAFTIRATQSGNAVYDAASNLVTSSVAAGESYVQVVTSGNASHALAIRADGTLWGWGTNSNGQLGDNTFTSRVIPTQIGAANTWRHVSVGALFSGGVRTDGTLWTWGANSSSQLGDGTTTTRLVPVRIGTATNWEAVAAGGTYFLAKKSDGTLWSWGTGPTGGLGSGSTSTITVPTQVGTDTAWQLIATTNGASIGSKSDGSLWAWGSNNSGQLGQGTTDTDVHASPVQIGTSAAWSNLHSLSCGVASVAAIRSDGTLWAWGKLTSVASSPVQIGTDSNWTSVSVGSSHTIGRKSDGTIWAWGSNVYGALGDGSGISRSTPTQIGADTDWDAVAAGTNVSFGLKQNGTLLSWGGGTNGAAVGPTGVTPRNPAPPSIAFDNVRAASAGPTHSLVVTQDGALWAFGSNSVGQLGDASGVAQLLPVRVGSSLNWRTVAAGGIAVNSGHSIGLQSDGTLWSWGANGFGQLGSGNTTSRSSPVKVGSSTTWTSVACGVGHTIALMDDGSLWGWGANSTGAVGDGSTTNRSSPVNIGNGQWLKVACGSDHSLAVRIDGTLWTWGANGSSQLGDGTTVSKLVPTQIGSDSQWADVAAGGSHSLALKSDGTMWSWGRNNSGQLGDGTTVNRNTPTRIEQSRTWLSIVGGNNHSLAITANGELWGWGNNSREQIPGLNESFSPSAVRIGTANRWAKCWTSSTSNTNLASHVLGSLWGFGINDHGQLASAGNNQHLPRYISPAFTNQTITFPSIDHLVLGAPVTLAASASSGLPVKYIVTGPATIVDSELAATGEGTVTITAYQPGDLFWQATDIVVQTVQAITLPTVITAVATSVSNNSAQLNGTVNPNGLTTTAKFQIGTSTDYGTDHPITLSPNNGTSTQNVTAAATGLAGHTLYHYRISATAGAGIAYGQDQIFTTLNSTPSLAPSTLTVTAARGLPVTQTGTYSDADGDNPSITGMIGGSAAGTVTLNTNAKTWTWTYIPTAVGTQTVTMNADDGFAGGTASTSFQVNTGTTLNASFASASVIPPGVSSPDLTGLSLNFSIGFVPSPGNQLTVINNTGAGSFVSRFTNLADGQIVPAAFSGTTYQFLASYAGGDGNDLVLSLVAAPSVSPPSATGVSTAAATLNATISANNADASARFEYGPTPAYGTAIDATPSSITGMTAVPVSAALVGLSPGTTYHYRAQATNAIGTTNGPDRTFRTLGPSLSNPQYASVSLVDGLTVTKAGTISVTASDPRGVSRVEFYVRPSSSGTDTLMGTATNGPSYQAYWNADLTASDGDFVITYKAYDSLGNFHAQSRTVHLVLAPPPAPTITAPINGSAFNRTSVIVAGTSQPDGQVALYRGGVLQVPMITAAADGTYSRTVELVDGLNQLQAASQNRAGEGPRASVTMTVDRTLPASPTAVQASSLANGVIQLAWTRSTGTVAGYNIYRATASFNDIAQAVRINSSPISGTSYTDTPATDGTYYYRVTAVNAATTESAPSSVISGQADKIAPAVSSIEYVANGKYDAATSRYGAGSVDVTVNLSEPLGSSPFFSISPQGGLPIVISLQRVTDLRYTGSFLISNLTPSGSATATISMRDVVGNRGTAITSGGSLLIDTAAPRVVGLSVAPGAPIKNNPASPRVVTFTATLDGAVKTGTTPAFSYYLSNTALTPVPIGSVAQGADSLTWNVVLTLPSTAGQTTENLVLSYQATDDFDNVGTSIVPPHDFEIYQGNLPGLDSPLGLVATSKPGGRIDLSWRSVTGAADYQVFRAATGSGTLAPLALTAGQLTYSDLPATDGSYDYTVAAVRQASGDSSTGAQSNVATASSDRLPPGTPTALEVQLVGQGVRANWLPPTGIAEPVTFNLYRSSVSGTDAELAAFVKDQLVVVDASPNPAKPYYSVTTMDVIGNESAPSARVYQNASLLPVRTLEVDLADNNPPVVTWSQVSGNIAGYDIYQGLGNQSSKLNLSGLLSTTSYTDTGYSPAADRTYTVVTVDSTQARSLGRSLTLPRITATLASDAVVNRGVMNRLIYTVKNDSAAAVANAQLNVFLAGIDHVSEVFSLAAGATKTVPVIVGGYASLTGSSAPIASTLFISPNAGETIAITRNGQIAVGTGSIQVDVIPGEFLLGGTGKVTFRVANTSSEEIEITTGSGQGSQPSPEVRFTVLDSDGNIVVTQSFKSVVGPDVVSLPNGNSVVRLPAGYEYTSPEAVLSIPATASKQLIVRLEIDKLYYHQGQLDEVVLDGLQTRADIDLTQTSYTAAVTSVTPAESNGDQDVVISGQATRRADSQPAATVPVKLIISKDGFDRTEIVTSDPTGAFTYSFKPLPGERGGVYQVRAIHPDISDRTTQATFLVRRVLVSPTEGTLRAVRNQTETVSVTASTGSGVTVHNIRMEYLAADQVGGTLPVGITVQPQAPIATVQGDQSVSLAATITGTTSAATSGSLVLRVSSDESNAGGWQKITVRYQLGDGVPSLRASPTFITTGVNPGSSVTESIRLENVGLVAATGITASILNQDGSAAPTWASVATDEASSNLAVGSRKDVNIIFQPAASVAQGDHFFVLRVVGSNIPTFDVNIHLALTAAGQGSVIFKVRDPFTGTLDSLGAVIQGLQGARVELQNEQVTSVQHTVSTDALGEVTINNLPAGSYKYRVSADKHVTSSGRFWVRPGAVANQEIALGYSPVTVDWQVVPVTLQDSYNIVLNATFETNVPTPVVVIDPPAINIPKLCKGDVFSGEYTVANYGLIRADDLNIGVPTSDAQFKVEMLTGVPTSLNAGEKVKVAYRMTALKNFGGVCPAQSASEGVNQRSAVASAAPLAGEAGGQAEGQAAAAAPASESECVSYFKLLPVTFTFECVNGLTFDATVYLPFFGKHGNCSDPASGVSWTPSNGGGGTSGPGGGGTSGPGGNGGGPSGNWGVTIPTPQVPTSPVLPPYKPIVMPDPLCYPVDVKFGSPLFNFEWGPEWLERVGCSVNNMSRRYEDDIVDMSVPIPGHRDQSASVLRKFRKGKWSFFETLEFVLDEQTSNEKYSELNWQDFRFYSASDDRTVFRSGGITIKVNYASDTARARLTTRDNSFIVFDSRGNIRSTGRNSTTFYTAEYDPTSHRTQVRAGATTLLTYEWTGALLTGVQDLTGRRVEYTYTDGLLTKVKDPALAVTDYLYDAYHRLARVTDSTGKAELITYKKTFIEVPRDGNGQPTIDTADDAEVVSILDESGRGKYFDFSYDQTTQERYAAIRTTGGAVDEKWFYADGQLKEWKRNGKLVKRQTKVPRTVLKDNNRVFRRTFTYSYFNGISQVSVLIMIAIPYPPDVWNLLSLDVTDANGNTWKEDYDEFGNLVKIENPDGTTKTFEYDFEGQLLQRAINENGIVTAFHYDANRNVTKTDEALGTPLARSTSLTFDAADRLLTTTWSGDANTVAATVTNAYDANGDLLQVTDAVGNAQQILARNALGSVTQRKDGNNKTWVSEFDPLNRVKQSTDPDTHTTKFEYDSFNNVTAITSPSNRRVDFAYDINNSLVTTTDPTSKVITNVYDDAKRLTKTIDREGKVTLYEYDELSRTTRVTDGAGTQICYEYDPQSASSDPVKIYLPTYTRSLAYNHRHQLVTSVDTLPEGRTITSSFTYSKTGALLTMTDGEGSTTTYVRDELDRPVSITRPDAGTVYFVYDARGQVIEFTNANGKKWTYAYDAAGRLKQEKTPLNKVTSFDFDGVGNLATITRPDGSRIERQFNAKGEVAWIQEFASGTSPPAKAITYTRDADGRVTSYSDGTTTGTYTFDAVGRLASETVNYGTFSATNSYTYYSNGLMKTCTSPAGTVSTYTYDSGNRLIGVSVPGVGEFSVTAYQANAIASMTLPGGTAMNYTRDGYQRPTLIKSVDPANNTLLNLNLGYSNLGNITSRNDGTGNRTLTYDQARRLKQGISSSYTYDANGNRLTDATAGVGTWQYDSDDRLLSDGRNTFVYDDNGSLVTKTGTTGSWAYTYDLEGRLVRVTKGTDVITYYYGPDGRRLSKTVNGVVTYFSYSAYGLSAEFDGTGTLKREYGYSASSGPGAAPLFVKTSAGVYFYHTDQLGTPQVLADADGNIVWRASYDDFGKASIAVNLVENNLRFPGHYFDAETGLYNNWHRYYDPETGRYISADPVRDGGNFYAYASNNPFAFTDPDGLRALHEALDWAGFIPVLGAIPDLLNALLYLAEGDYGNAGLNAFAAIPGFGDAAKGIKKADDVIDAARAARGRTELADDVFKHGLDYDPRVRARAVEDGVGHNFPYSFDDAILGTDPVALRGGAQGYAMRGTHNGKDVVYNIVVEDGVVTHRDFVSAANWAQRSRSFGFNIDYAKLPRQ